MFAKDISETAATKNDSCILPHVCIIRPDPIDFRFGLDLMNILREQHHIDCAGLTVFKSVHDKRFFSIDKFNVPVGNILSYIEKHTKAVIIISIFSWKELNDMKGLLDANMFFIIENNRVDIIIDEKIEFTTRSKRIHPEEICNHIVRYLS